jgi:hypothetical protein
MQPVLTRKRARDDKESSAKRICSLERSIAASREHRSRAFADKDWDQVDELDMCIIADEELIRLERVKEQADELLDMSHEEPPKIARVVKSRAYTL